jgi:hypothetical protein
MIGFVVVNKSIVKFVLMDTLLLITNIVITSTVKVIGVTLMRCAGMVTDNNVKAQVLISTWLVME